jgi:hypothetical protein
MNITDIQYGQHEVQTKHSNDIGKLNPSQFLNEATTLEHAELIPVNIITLLAC